MSATIRENLLVSMAMYAGEMDQICEIDLPYGTADLPYGTAGEDDLADFCVDCVDHYMQTDMDIPFDIYAQECLASKFGRKEESKTEYCDTVPTHRVLAVAGRVEKVLFEGSHDECEWFCDTYDWEWSETPDGFVWDLEVEEI